MTSYIPLFLAVVLSYFSALAGADNDEPLGTIVIEPLELQLLEGSTQTVRWSAAVSGVQTVRISVEDESILRASNNTFSSETAPNATISGTFNVSGIFMGYSNINITLLNQQNEVLEVKELRASVIVGYHILYQIYMVSLGLLLFVAFINMGCVFDPSIFKAVFKRPVGPLVALFCQFVAMPLMAFGLSKLFFPNEPIYQLGLFLCGIVPGGGTSNMWAYLVGGNFDLSLVMTAVSSTVAFGAIPLWTVILGPHISTNRDIVVPIKDIALLVSGLIIPCVIGYLIQRFLPKIAKFFEAALTPLIIFIFVFTLTFGAYANRYVFQLFTFKIALAALSLPTLGYTVGVCMSLLFKCPRKDVIAISIETGIQNMGLVVFMLNYTLPAPSDTISIVIPASSAFLTPFPVILMGIILHAYDGNINKANTKFILRKMSKCEWDFMTPNVNAEGNGTDSKKDINLGNQESAAKEGVDNDAFSRNESA